MTGYSDYSLELIVALARPTSHDTMLDVGTGSGEAAIGLADTVRSIEAVDDRPEIIEEARRLAGTMGVANATFTRGDLYSLPFDDATFSLVVCRDALHRLPEPVAALREMARVLSQGGRLVVYEVVVDELLDRPLNELAKLREPAHRRYHRPQEYEQLFEKAGLGIADRRQGRRTVDLAYWLEAAGVSNQRWGVIRSRMQELPVKVQGAMDVAFSDRMVSFSFDVMAWRLER